MFIVAIFFLTSLYHGTQAISVFRRDVSPTCPLRRSLFTIIWDCWSTIFICAWVSVHPNIPPTTEWGRKALWRRANLMFWAVIAPEVVLAWAVRQWFAAGEIAEIYNNHKGISPIDRGLCAYLWLVIKCWIIGRKMKTNEAWTKMHGHFLCMGGFVIGNDEEAVNHGDPAVEPAGNGGATTSEFANNEVVSFEGFKRLIAENNFEVSITEQEIEDKSKRDSLSKFIAIIQTSKFITQCIARWRQNLALTELELITLALASLNAITYTFWWAKPYDVKVPVKVYLKSNRRPQDNTVGQLPQATARGELTIDEDEHKPMFPFTAVQFRRNNTRFFKELLIEIFDITRSPCKDHSFWTLVFRWFFVLPICLTFLGFFPIYFVIVYIFASLNDIVDTVHVPTGATHVPIFYAPRTKEEGVFRFVIFAIFGVVFGGLHCIGWHFAYPTLIERTLWRSASVAITLIPFVSMFIMLISFMASQNKKMRGDIFIKSIVNVVTGAAITFGTLQLFLYVLARLVLLGQAMASLRAPPSSAFQEINWIKSFPHIASSDNA